MTDAEISVTIPAESRFVAMARVTAASLAAELDFSVDAIEELRVGANELVALLVEWAEDNGASSIELRFGLSADALAIAGEVHGASNGDAVGVTEGLDDLTRQILGAVVDEFDIGPGHGRIVKRRLPA